MNKIELVVNRTVIPATTSPAGGLAWSWNRLEDEKNIVKARRLKSI